MVSDLQVYWFFLVEYKSHTVTFSDVWDLWAIAYAFGQNLYESQFMFVCSVVWVCGVKGNNSGSGTLLPSVTCSAI